MANQTRTSTPEELRRALQDKERELSELNLILADYHSEHSRLIRELRWLRAQLRDEEETASSLSET